MIAFTKSLFCFKPVQVVTMDTTAITNAAFTVKFLDNVTENQGNVKEDVKAVGKYRTVMVVNINYITVKKVSMVFCCHICLTVIAH